MDWHWQHGDALLASDGSSVTLDHHVGGNRSSVWTIQGSDRYLAKLTPSPQPDLPRLVEAAIDRQLGRPVLPGVIVAAPLLWLTTLDGDVAGCLMARLDTAPVSLLSTVYEVTSPAEARPSTFDDGAPTISMRQRIADARLFAAGVHWIHGLEFLIGDLKPDNIFRHDDGAPIVFLDADSFSVLDKGHVVFQRKAFTDGYRAPELTAGAGPSYDSDRFAAAVIIVQHLLGGLHPFAYSMHGDRADDQGRITNGHAWVLDPMDYRVPTGHPGIWALPEALRELATRALLETADRPSLDRWIRALDVATVEPCSACGRDRYAGGDCIICPGACVAPAPAFRPEPPQLASPALGPRPEILTDMPYVLAPSTDVPAPKRRNGRIAARAAATVAILALTVGAAIAIDRATRSTQLADDTDLAAPTQLTGDPDLDVLKRQGSLPFSGVARTSSTTADLANLDRTAVSLERWDVFPAVFNHVDPGAAPREEDYVDASTPNRLTVVLEPRVQAMGGGASTSLSHAGV